MRVYFISEERAALKLDGQYAGTIDAFERYADIDGARGALAEIVPYENGQPLNFFIDENFFARPHDFADTYSSCGEHFIRIDGYADKCGLQVLAQANTDGTIITVFRAGGIYAACEGADCGKADYAIFPLPHSFRSPEITETECGGLKFAAVKSGRMLALFCGCRQAFCGEADKYSLGASLNAEVCLRSCTDAVAEREYLFDGEKFVLNSQKITERRPPCAGAEHIAFFESVLYGGDCSARLCDELKEHAGALKDYLGNFTAVLPPCGRALELYGERSAGLLYRENGRLFKVKYFKAEMQDGKIANIFPADEE